MPGESAPRAPPHASARRHQLCGRPRPSPSHAVSTRCCCRPSSSHAVRRRAQRCSGGSANALTPAKRARAPDASLQPPHAAAAPCKRMHACSTRAGITCGAGRRALCPRRAQHARKSPAESPPSANGRGSPGCPRQRSPWHPRPSSAPKKWSAGVDTMRECGGHGGGRALRACVRLRRALHQARPSPARSLAARGACARPPRTRSRMQCRHAATTRSARAEPRCAPRACAQRTPTRPPDLVPPKPRTSTAGAAATSFFSTSDILMLQRDSGRVCKGPG